jgi:hypothetical protein
MPVRIGGFANSESYELGLGLFQPKRESRSRTNSESSNSVAYEPGDNMAGAIFICKDDRIYLRQQVIQALSQITTQVRVLVIKKFYFLTHCKLYL